MKLEDDQDMEQLTAFSTISRKKWTKR